MSTFSGFTLADLRIIAPALKREAKWLRDRLFLHGKYNLVRRCEELLADAEAILNENPYEHLRGDTED